SSTKWDSAMLKTVPSFVLNSTKSSTYPRGYASGFVSSAALLDNRFEHRAFDNTVMDSRLP
ncbi:MAG TPA: hypothetical protein VFI05_04820, partial [Nitrospiraceae bacterium]|nr:hypothetical protein [Nitrospiraceae bacterium]